MDAMRHVRLWTANCARAGDPNGDSAGSAGLSGYIEEEEVEE
jgi:hypothetical protein